MIFVKVLLFGAMSFSVGKYFIITMNLYTEYGSVGMQKGATDFYEHPYHAQPRACRYNKLNRDTGAVKNTLGYSTETRKRSLGGMPFGSSLQLDMEIWSWTDCDMAYGVGMYWYGDLESTCNRMPDPEGVLVKP